MHHSGMIGCSLYLSIDIAMITAMIKKLFLKITAKNEIFFKKSSFSSYSKNLLGAAVENVFS